MTVTEGHFVGRAWAFQGEEVPCRSRPPSCLFFSLGEPFLTAVGTGRCTYGMLIMLLVALGRR